jgi:serine/threonine protein kinase
MAGLFLKKQCFHIPNSVIDQDQRKAIILNMQFKSLGVPTQEVLEHIALDKEQADKIHANFAAYSKTDMNVTVTLHEELTNARIPQGAYDIIMKCLNVDHTQRPTMEEIMSMSWFNENARRSENEFA